MRWPIRAKPNGQFVLDDVGGCRFSLQPLLARTQMGDLRIASLSCPKALYYAIYDILRAGDSGFQEDDQFVFDGHLIMKVAKGYTPYKPGLQLVIAIEPVEWDNAFGVNGQHDGRLNGIPQTACILDLAVEGEELGC